MSRVRRGKVLSLRASSRRYLPTSMLAELGRGEATEEPRHGRHGRAGDRGQQMGRIQKEFLNSLYYYWKTTRYATDSESMFPAVEDLVSGQKGNSSTGAAVPVCFSPQPLKDLTRKSRYIEGTLPCVCGNDLGNETTAFLDVANFKSWVAVEDGVGLDEVCTKSFEMDRVNPIHTYSAVKSRLAVAQSWKRHSSHSRG